LQGDIAVHKLERRNITKYFAVSILVNCVAPSKLSAQGILFPLRKIAWGLIFEAISAGFAVLDHLPDWLKPNDRAVLPICSISRTDIVLLSMRCRQVALSLRSDLYGPTTDGGDRGVIPALSFVLTKRDPIIWQTAKDELTRALDDIDRLLNEISRMGGYVSLDSTGKPRDELLVLERALKAARPSMVDFQSAAPPQDDADTSLLKQLLDRLLPLPVAAQRATRAASEATDIRLKSSCP
jgi:hypothetical protein